ncbi:MAG: FtsH protease activity modulator HflK [Rhodospirillales bacterium]|nr:FtsH protease activity modulator HflK [Rhodospirillales bacterium]
MPWKNQGGGPWGGGGQGPTGGGPRGPQPPDIEEMIRKSQAKFRSLIPGGAGGGRGLALVLVIAVVFWAFSGVYRVNPGEQGVELLFGEYKYRTGPGIHFWPPTPIGDVIKVNVENTNTINIGFRGEGSRGGSVGARDVSQESLMLTGDQNIIDIDFVVQWRIKNAADFLFNIRNPEVTIKIASESAMREIIGQTPLEEALTTSRQKVQDDALILLQNILDGYGAGVFIAKIQLQKVDPPQDVIDAFNDVQRAKQDQERIVNEARAYTNNIVPRAQGLGQKMIEDAGAYRQQVINEAEGEAQRFLSVYNAYKGNKLVTKRRIYLERMQEVLNSADMVIIDQGGGSGVVPYLPLPEIKKRSTGAAQ